MIQRDLFGGEGIQLNVTKLTEDVMNNYNGAWASDRLLAKGCLEKLGIKLEGEQQDIIMFLIHKFPDFQRVARKIREADKDAKS